MSDDQSLGRYVQLVRRYHQTLDLVSDAALADIERLVAEGTSYARLIGRLSPAPHRVIDIGSGVGLPGLPMAVALPRCHFTLVERRRRRVSFLRVAVSQLGLENVSIVAADVEDLRDEAYDAVTAQAVGSYDAVYRLSCHLHAERVWLVSRKGDDWHRERDRLESRLGTSFPQVEEVELSGRGRLVAIGGPGGLDCPRSA